MDAEFMATAAAFIGRYNATLSAPPAVASYRGLWWKAPGGSENGWSINFARQEKTIFGTWFAYDTTGTSCQ
jgi:hypothetical protein